MGVACADYDGDGDIDVYLCNFGKDALYKNNGDGSFTNVTVDAGITVEGISVQEASNTVATQRAMLH